MSTMKETTVAEMIKLLEGFDPNAIICTMILNGDEPEFDSIEFVNPIQNTKYFNCTGDETIGNIVAIY